MADLNEQAGSDALRLAAVVAIAHPDKNPAPAIAAVIARLIMCTSLSALR